MPVGGDAFLSGIEGVLEGGGWEVRWGRDLLWLGGFESEGADLWDANTADEWLDDTVALAGQRSLALRRTWDAGDQTGTDLERHLPCDGTREHTAVGWLRGQNAPQARILARFYDNRYSENPIADLDVADPVTGDLDWTRQWRDLDSPDHATFFELRCGAWPPTNGEGTAWFDELALIEWEAWEPAGGNTVPSPNNYRFVQVRRVGGTVEPATLAWRETRYGDVTTAGARVRAGAGRVGPPGLLPQPLQPAHHGAAGSAGSWRGAVPRSNCTTCAAAAWRCCTTGRSRAPGPTPSPGTGATTRAAT